MTKTVIEEIDIGNSVICDQCGTDYTNSEEKGGFLFGSNAVCPKCAPDMFKSIKKHKEESHIKGICPSKMSFKDWVISLRGGNNKITITKM